MAVQVPERRVLQEVLCPKGRRKNRLLQIGSPLGCFFFLIILHPQPTLEILSNLRQWSQIDVIILNLCPHSHDAAHGLLETTSWNKRLLRRRAIVDAYFVEDKEEKTISEYLSLKKISYLCTHKRIRIDGERLQYIQRRSRLRYFTALLHGAWDGEDVPER